jgi:hypothetical protein
MLVRLFASIEMPARDRTQPKNSTHNVAPSCGLFLNCSEKK